MRRHISFKSLAAGMFAVAVGLGVGAGMAFADKAEKETKAKLGEAAPAFTLVDQEGKSHSLSDFEGKVVVLEQFNDECPYVVKFYRDGHMNRMAEQYTEQGVVWLAVNSSNDHGQEHNKKIAQEWNMERPLLDDKSGTFGRAYGMQRTPEFRIINAEGQLVYMGGIDSIRSSNTADIDKAKNYVSAALDQVLAGETVARPETPAYGCAVKY